MWCGPREPAGSSVSAPLSGGTSCNFPSRNCLLGLAYSARMVDKLYGGTSTGLFRADFCCRPIEIDALDPIELVRDGAAQNIGKARIGAEADDGSDAGCLPLCMLRFLLHGENAHSAVVHVSTFRREARFENRHLEARKVGTPLMQRSQSASRASSAPRSVTSNTRVSSRESGSALFRASRRSRLASAAIIFVTPEAKLESRVARRARAHQACSANNQNPMFVHSPHLAKIFLSRAVTLRPVAHFSRTGPSPLTNQIHLTHGAAHFAGSLPAARGKKPACPARSRCARRFRVYRCRSHRGKWQYSSEVTSHCQVPGVQVQMRTQRVHRGRGLRESRRCARAFDHGWNDAPILSGAAVRASRSTGVRSAAAPSQVM